VPDLHGKTLRNAKRALKRKGCALGTVKGQGKRVAHQGARAGRTLNRGSAVSVSLR
jgi:beta-lactam-binding protein with PASTA domain